MSAFAFVFPGQGSQSVGMLDAWGDHPVVEETLKEASDALGEDIGRLIHEGPKEALALTTNTQPVMLVAGVAAWRVWRAEGGALPAAVAGHSLGEYSALVASGTSVVSIARRQFRRRRGRGVYACGWRRLRGRRRILLRAHAPRHPTAQSLDAQGCSESDSKSLSAHAFLKVMTASRAREATLDSALE